MPDIRYGELNAWRIDANESHQMYMKKVADEAEARRKEAQRIHEERVEYVNDRIRNIHHRQQQEHRHCEQKEIDRIEKRKDDRLERKAARIAGYEAKERELMKEEDVQGWWMRYHANEYILYTREAQNMYQAELEQTRIDRFWGLLVADEERLAEIARRDKAYADKVEEMRVKCIQAYIIKPYAWESKAKKFHDVFTNDVIT